MPAAPPGARGARSPLREEAAGRRRVDWDCVRRDDVLRAVGTLKPLGSSYSIIKVGSKPFIRSVPKELNTDQSAVLEAVQLLGYIDVSTLMVNLAWPQARAQTAVDDLVGEGMLWVDLHNGATEYWSPGFMLEGQHAILDV